jgi:hypothetical protein
MTTAPDPRTPDAAALATAMATTDAAASPNRGY